MVDQVASQPEAFVFPAPDGGPLAYSNWRRRVWLPAIFKAGHYVLEPDPKRPDKLVWKPTLGFHDLRRTNATAMVRDKVDVKTAQARLGHSDPRLTLAIYAQATSEGDVEASERLGQRFMADITPLQEEPRGITRDGRGMKPYCREIPTSENGPDQDSFLTLSPKSGPPL